MYKIVVLENCEELSNWIKDHGCSRIENNNEKLDRSTLLGEIMKHPDGEMLLFQIMNDAGGREKTHSLKEAYQLYVNHHPEERENVLAFINQYRRNRTEIIQDLTKKYREYAKNLRVQKVTDEEAIQVLTSFVESNLSKKDFLAKIDMTSKKFDDIRHYAKERNLPIYQKYEDISKKNSLEGLKKIDDIVNEILTFLDSDEYSELEYFLRFTFNPEVLNNLVKSYRYKISSGARQKLKKLIMVTEYNYINIIKDGTYIIKGHKITDEEKERTIAYMKKHHLPYSELIFKQALRKLEIV